MKLALLAVFYCLAPAGVLWLCRRYKWIGKIGPILMLYFIGAIMANIGILPSKGPESESLLKIQDLFTNVTIPLAIPLMLFCFTYKKSETRDQLLAMITGLAAVIIAVVAGYPIFGPHIPDGPRVAGMYTACLTGGTVNMAAVSKSLGSPDTQYALLNTYDMIVSFTYLVFIMAFGIRLARKFLPVKTLNLSNDENSIKEELKKAEENPYKGLFTTKKGWHDLLILLGVTLLVVGASAVENLPVAFGRDHVAGLLGPGEECFPIQGETHVDRGTCGN